MKKYWTISLLLAMVACGEPSAEWTEGEWGAGGLAQQTLVLKNVPGGARVWFQELYDQRQVTEPEGLAFCHYQGTSVYVDIPKNAGKELVIKYMGRNLPRRSWAPEGFVLQQEGKKDKPFPVTYHFREREGTEPDARWFEASYEPGPAEIIPRPKKVRELPEGHPFPFEDLRKGLPSKEGLGTGHPEGWYQITWDASGEAHVISYDDAGAYYARVTLDKMPGEVKNMLVEDWPDMPWRGFMLDVVRDFRSKEEVLKVLDIMASYKLNLLHFHLGDDEAWCLEIPSLPDLTAFSGHHALPDWNLQESQALKPMAGGRIGDTTFYTAEDYKDILRYAWERNIQVLPEFDAPGHSRAAIKAMQAYELRTGDDSYRLQDPADTSRYMSAQNFTDNVVDPDLPGVYKLYGLVFDEVIRMHAEAGVPLPGIHIGGDEVPRGCWAGRDRKQVKDRFTRGMLQLAKERGVKLAGWQEMARGIGAETLELLKPQLLFVNVWDTRGSKMDLTYELANEGIPVLVCNVQNTYIDLAYGNGPTDIGLHWGGYLDERKSFALQPFRNYESVRWKDVDTPVDWAQAAEGRTPLQRPDMLMGTEALLWSENIRSFDDVTFQMLPKALGVWERAWNACPQWPDDEAFAQDFDHFYSIVKTKEMPAWDARGLHYKKR